MYSIVNVAKCGFGIYKMYNGMETPGKDWEYKKEDKVIKNH